MKILVINGSPKREKSDTLHLTHAFLDGMNSVHENEIRYINVAEKHIEYCLGDLSCMKNGGKCVHNDDMAQILGDILTSDMLLFSFPLYGFGVPAPLKALLDRTLPLGSLAMRKVGDRYEHVEQADFSHLRYAVISGCGFPNAQHNFDALRLQFKLRFPNGVFMLTVSEAPMFSAIEAAAVTAPFLELVRHAGREYAEFGIISDELAEKLAVPMIPEETYAAICNGNA
ncbi:MAG: flavodoxin family protein [Clostridiales bacterium]|nr:flavodoxin family protein [Clostridiales bacterium]